MIDMKVKIQNIYSWSSQRKKIQDKIFMHLPVHTEKVC